MSPSPEQSIIKRDKSALRVEWKITDPNGPEEPPGDVAQMADLADFESSSAAAPSRPPPVTWKPEK